MESLLTLGLGNAAAAAVLAVAAACLGLVLGRRPALRHCLWLVVLAKLITPPLWELPVPPLERPAAGVSSAVDATFTEAPIGLPASTILAYPESVTFVSEPVPAASESATVGMIPRPTERHLGVVAWLGLAWISGSVVMVLLAAIRVVRFRRGLEAGMPAPDDVQGEAAALANTLGLKAAPTVWFLDAPVAPMLWCVGGGPRLIVPLMLWKTLGRRQRSLVLAHELAHLRRGDHLVRLFELVVTILFWWLPVVWWARRALREAEEQCCDAWVVWAFPDEARAYAEVLLDTIEYLNPSPAGDPLLASGFGRAHHLRRRLTMIMLGTTRRSLGSATAFAALALSAILLPIRPSWAQKPAEDARHANVEIEINEDKSADPTKANASQVHVVVATDGESEEIRTDSLKRAVEILRQRIDKLSKEDAHSDKGKAQVKAMKQVLGELEKASAVKIDSVLVTKNPAGKVIVQDLNVLTVDPRVAEAHARIDEARKRIAMLREVVEQKTKELVAAEADLARLSASSPPGINVNYEGEFVVTKPAGNQPARLLIRKFEPKRPEQDWKPLPAAGQLGGDDRKRLESLEKNLAKLLEEVERMKKKEAEGQGKGGGPTLAR